MMRTNLSICIKIIAVLTALLLPMLGTHKAISAAEPSSQGEEQSAIDSPPLIEVDTAEQAAQIGLEVLRQIGKEKKDEEYAKSLGFNSANEVRRLHLGNPLYLYRVSLIRLKGFQKRDPLEKLFYNTEILMYPLLVDEKARSVITVKPSPPGKGWHPTGAGYGEFIRLVEKYRTPGADIVILVSDLGLKFLATRTEDEFQLIPLSERKDFGILPGPPALSARETFAKLSLQASKYHQPLPERQAIKGNH